jgi:hypothetical protein
VTRRQLSRTEFDAALPGLRERCSCVAFHASAGAQVRELVSGFGCQVWPPDEDHLWRRWIERHGDEQARHFLHAMIAAARQRLVEIEARRTT